MVTILVMMGMCLVWLGWLEMREVVARVALLCALMTSAVYAEKAPLGADQLLEQAELVVVGTIETIDIQSEASRIESAAGNYDWSIQLGIRVDQTEKGDAGAELVSARCFRIKSRKSAQEFLTPSGNDVVPAIGTKVRAYLVGSPDDWQVIYPNGLESPDGQTELQDAPEVAALSSAGYSYFLPTEVIWVLALLGLIGFAIVVIWTRWGARKRSAAENAS